MTIGNKMQKKLHIIYDKILLKNIYLRNLDANESEFQSESRENDYEQR
jgi:hypothetical protein